MVLRLRNGGVGLELGFLGFKVFLYIIWYLLGDWVCKEDKEVGLSY